VLIQIAGTLINNAHTEMKIALVHKNSAIS